MRWTAIGLVGLLAGFITWASGPLFAPLHVSGRHVTDTYSNFWYDVMIFAIYAPFLVALIGGTLAVFRALWLTTRRAELASLIALGRTRRSLIGDHVRAGLLDGLIASAAIVVAGAIRQAVTGVSRVEFVPFVAANYGVTLGIVLASFVLAYWIAAAWATRGSVREVASGHRADARASSRTPGKSRGRKHAGWWVAGAVVAAWVALGVMTSFGLDAGSGSTGVVMVRGFALLTVGAVIVIPLVLARAGATLAVWSTRKVAQRMGAAAEPGSARSLAADGLARPTPLRTAATAAVVLVMGASVAITATTFATSDTHDTSSQLVPPAYVSTIALQDHYELHVTDQSGWATALPQELVDELRADPALIVVEAGLLITDRNPDVRYGAPQSHWPRGMYIAVDPHALDAVIPDAWKRLYIVDRVVDPWGQYGWTDSFDENTHHLIVDGERTDVTWSRDHAPWSGMSRTWAEEVWGPAPTSAVLLYQAADESVESALSEHDLQEFAVAIDASFSWYGSRDGAVVALFTTPFLVVAVALVIALAWSSQRLRARENATLLALGAASASLRKAAALESGILTLIAATIGVVGGAIIGPVWAATSAAPWGAAPADLVWWNIGQNVGLIPWVTVIGLALGAAAIAAAGAALLRVRLERLSPAEQLAEAHRVGVS